MSWLAPLKMAQSSRRGPPSKEVRQARDGQMALYLAMGLSQREIAKRLKISRTAVQKRMRRS